MIHDRFNDDHIDAIAADRRHTPLADRTLSRARTDTARRAADRGPGRVRRATARTLVRLAAHVAQEPVSARPRRA